MKRFGNKNKQVASVVSSSSVEKGVLDDEKQPLPLPSLPVLYFYDIPCFDSLFNYPHPIPVATYYLYRKNPLPFPFPPEFLCLDLFLSCYSFLVSDPSNLVPDYIDFFPDPLFAFYASNALRRWYSKQRYFRSYGKCPPVVDELKEIEEKARRERRLKLAEERSKECKERCEEEESNKEEDEEPPKEEEESHREESHDEEMTNL